MPKSIEKERGPRVGIMGLLSIGRNRSPAGYTVNFVEFRQDIDGRRCSRGFR